MNCPYPNDLYMIFCVHGNSRNRMVFLIRRLQLSFFVTMKSSNMQVDTSLTGLAAAAASTADKAGRKCVKKVQ